MRWPEFGRGLRKDNTIEGRWILQRWRGDRDERSFPEAMTKGTVVPWQAEGIAPGVLARFLDQPTFDTGEHDGF
jgi:hypothetical protein